MNFLLSWAKNRELLATTSIDALFPTRGLRRVSMLYTFVSSLIFICCWTSCWRTIFSYSSIWFRIKCPSFLRCFSFSICSFRSRSIFSFFFCSMSWRTSLVYKPSKQKHLSYSFFKRLHRNIRGLGIADNTTLVTIADDVSTVLLFLLKFGEILNGILQLRAASLQSLGIVHFF